MTEDFIPTSSGNKIYYTNPKPGQIELEDLAHGLAMNSRFGGQTTEFYSVAKHSILVSKELEKQGFGPKVQVYGLLHDAAEAYVGDVPAPLKKELENFRKIEHGIMDAIWGALDIQPPSDEDWKRIKKADRVLLNYEASEIVSQDGWTEEVNRDYKLKSNSWEDDKRKFMEKFRELQERF